MPQVMHFSGRICDLIFSGWVNQTWDLRQFVLDFRYVAPPQNESNSKVIGVENQGQILDFFTPVKLGSMGEMSWVSFCAWPWTRDVKFREKISRYENYFSRDLVEISSAL